MVQQKKVQTTQTKGIRRGNLNEGINVAVLRNSAILFLFDMSAQRVFRNLHATENDGKRFSAQCTIVLYLPVLIILQAHHLVEIPVFFGPLLQIGTHHIPH